jgi:hypothetical protein
VLGHQREHFPERPLVQEKGDLVIGAGSPGREAHAGLPAQFRQ